jgi:hypothetical protein
MEESPSREADGHSENSPHFVEPKSSLPCSKEAAIGSYPETDPSSPHLPALFP